MKNLTQTILFVTTIFLGGCFSLYKASNTTTHLVPADIKKVAILPFDNISGRKDAGRIVVNIFVAELVKSQAFEVVEPGDIKQFLIEEKVTDIGKMDAERLKLLGRRFGADAVIVGTVEEFDDGIKGGGSSIPVVSITARMVRTDNGIVLWPGSNTSRGDDSKMPFDFGKIRSVTTLTQKIVRDMIKEMR